MSYEIGQTVVYPHHGAAVIEEISTRVLRGEERTYLTLRVTANDMIIKIPEANVEQVGVRDVVDEDGLARVVAVLRSPVENEPSNWSRRFKANGEKIASGDILKVAEVVRDLTFRDHGRGLSAGEKRMLSKARAVLISELSLAKEEDEESAEKRLNAIMSEALQSAGVDPVHLVPAAE